MTNFETIIDDFAFLDDWDDRYKYIIDLGRSLSPYPEEQRNEKNKVKGCASQVWLTYETLNAGNDTIIKLHADSDAHIVRGLVAILLALYSDKTADQITKIDPQNALQPLDLGDHLTPQRSNGLASMITTVQMIAKSNLNAE